MDQKDNLTVFKLKTKKVIGGELGRVVCDEGTIVRKEEERRKFNFG